MCPAAQRRTLQQEYNQKHGITPTTVQREIAPLVELEKIESDEQPLRKVAERPEKYLTATEIEKKIKFYEQEMKKAAKEMRFEDAAKFRDLMRDYQNFELGA